MGVEQEVLSPDWCGQTCHIILTPVRRAACVRSPEFPASPLMSFSDHLEVFMTKEWRKQYISYSLLETMLYADVSHRSSDEGKMAEN
ncbi:hypothetical protein AGIG_G19311 [Arapaima gigas]